MEWKKWGDAWPDWQDAGKCVEIERADGATVAGKLDVDDFFPDGEGDEVPVFAVIDDAGVKHSFADNERWRFLPTPNAGVTGPEAALSPEGRARTQGYASAVKTEEDK